MGHTKQDAICVREEERVKLFGMGMAWSGVPT
jgi:hypothetical protein